MGFRHRAFRARRARGVFCQEAKLSKNVVVRRLVSSRVVSCLCIRALEAKRHRESAFGNAPGRALFDETRASPVAVSYTHLTLPTILLV